jgi:hypothetical protein
MRGDATARNNQAAGVGGSFFDTCQMCPQAGQTNHHRGPRRDASTKTLTGLLPHCGQSTG